MTQLEDRLTDLLHRGAPRTKPVAYEPVARLGRSVRRRRRGQALAGAALALIGLGVGLGFTVFAGSTDGGREELTTRPTPTATPSAVASSEEISQGGLTYAIPSGWKRQLTGFCGPQPNHTVAGAFTPSMRCPYESVGNPRETVRLGPIWTKDSSGGWTGKPTDWHGQLAYLDTFTSLRDVVEVLSFPLLNARVTAEASSATAARALLDRVTAHPAALPIPQDAYSIRIVRTNAVRPQSPPVVITDSSIVGKFLDDLRHFGKAGADTCLPALTTTPTVITVQPSNGAAISYLTSPDACPILTAGTGAAVSASPAFVADIDRYVPANLNVAPDPSVTVPVCSTSQLTGSWGGHVSPETQEHSAIVNLRNDGGTCQVFGYPFIDLFGDAGQIGAITENGGGYILDAPGVTVLQPGESAHLTLAASSCGQSAQTVTRLQVTLRGNLMPLSITIPAGASDGIQMCPGYNGALLQIGPLVPGAEQGQ